MRVRYPRTPHLPWSPGATADDVRLVDLASFKGREVVVTEKLDGENTTLYSDGLHARSPDSAHHPSRAWVKALHGRIRDRIPAGFRISGENVHARHSIAYADLESFFYAFSVWNGDDALSWDETVRFAADLGLPTPPVLFRGVFQENALRRLKIDPARQEGYVVRLASGFSRDDFTASVAKWVRRDHVQTDEHWMRGPFIENERGPRAALWAARGGELVPARTLLDLLPPTLARPPREADDTRLSAVHAGLDALGRFGDARVEAAFAALLPDLPRGELMMELAVALGPRLARRIADVAALAPKIASPEPENPTPRGLRWMSLGADLGVAHAVARAAHASDAQAVDAIAWSELLAEEHGLLAREPIGELRRAVRAEFAGIHAMADARIAEQCWAEARSGWVRGALVSAPEAIQATFRMRSARRPRLTLFVGPSGSGKSSLAAHDPSDTRERPSVVIALDALRESRGARADQSENAAVLGEALEKLHGALASGRDVIWDATSLIPQQRKLPESVAHRLGAQVWQVVFLTPRALLGARNATRAHAVPVDVLDEQIARCRPPFPGDADRLVYRAAAARDGAAEATDSTGGLDDDADQ
ncbi:MAG: RNA ligase family protein [Polyangiaceae bacterium]